MSEESVMETAFYKNKMITDGWIKEDEERRKTMDIREFAVNMYSMKKVVDRGHICLCATKDSGKFCPCDEFFVLKEGETCKCGVFRRLYSAFNLHVE